MLGRNLKKLLEKNKISAKKLAEDLDVSATHLSYVINGKRNLSPELELKIAEILNVSTDRLRGESASSIIEDRLEFLNMHPADLAVKAGVSLSFITELDNIIPDDQDYVNIARIAKILGLPAGSLRAALARQEPPSYDGPAASSAEEAFKDFSEPEVDFAFLRVMKDAKEKGFSPKDLEKALEFLEWSKGRKD